MIQKQKGTEDILPQSAYIWQYLEDVARDIFSSYNFKEIRTPLFEAVELFSRSVGDSSDIVSKEMYDFQDKGGRHIALRPEGTAPVVRAFVEHKLYGPEHPQPLKVYYMGPMFRYERPQSGRYRQFHQMGMEVFGATHPAVDVEGIALAWDYLNEIGLEALTIHINSLGQPQDRLAYRQALVDYYEPLKDQLSEDSQRRLHDNPLRILDSKDPRDKAFLQEAPVMLDYLSPDSQAHFQAVQELLEGLGIPFQVNPYIVRGLDYYQETIFEIIVEDDSIGAQSTVCGGGRYDGLVEMLGGPSSPGFGFAMGMERLILLLEAQEVDLPAEEGLDVFFLVQSEPAQELALQLAQAGRKAGLNVDRDYMGRSLKSQFKTAASHKARLLAVLGESEVESQTIQLKDQDTGQESQVSVADLMDNFAGIYRQLTMDTQVIDNFFEGE